MVSGWIIYNHCPAYLRGERPTAAAFLVFHNGMKKIVFTCYGNFIIWIIQSFTFLMTTLYYFLQMNTDWVIIPLGQKQNWISLSVQWVRGLEPQEQVPAAAIAAVHNQEYGRLSLLSLQDISVLQMQRKSMSSLLRYVQFLSRSFDTSIFVWFKLFNITFYVLMIFDVLVLVEFWNMKC